MMNIIKNNSKMDPTSFQNSEEWVSGVTGELPGETLGPKRRSSEKKTSQKELFPPPGDTFSALFFPGIRYTKKGGSGRAFKTKPVFWSILGSARRASGGFPCTRELNFHFCSRAQKGLQNGSKSLAFWAPKSELYSLWGAICEKLVPKKLHRKKGAKSRG